MSRNRKLKYGNADVLTASDLDMKNAKMRITTMVDKSVLDALKSEAKATGKKYQSILNDILASHYFSPRKTATASGKEGWENEIGKIKKRLAALEKQKTA